MHFGFFEIEVTLVSIIAASTLHKQIKVEFGLIICQFQCLDQVTEQESFVVNCRC